MSATRPFYSLSHYTGKQRLLQVKTHFFTDIFANFVKCWKKNTRPQVLFQICADLRLAERENRLAKTIQNSYNGTGRSKKCRRGEVRDVL